MAFLSCGFKLDPNFIVVMKQRQIEVSSEKPAAMKGLLYQQWEKGFPSLHC